MNTENLILVKLGGSLITDKNKPYTAKIDVIKRLTEEINEARKKVRFKLILGHGGGSFPHQSAHKYQTQKGVINNDSYHGISEVQKDAANLNRIIVQALLDARENAITIMPSSSCFTDRGRITEWYTKPIEKALDYDMIPVPYGDVGFDSSQGCCIISTEEILRFLGTKFRAKKIIFVGKTDGVFTADPNIDSNAKLIPKITNGNFEDVKKYLSGSESVDVTGGMLHKVEQALELAKSGIETQIISGMKEGNLKKALIGEDVKGTLIR